MPLQYEGRKHLSDVEAGYFSFGTTSAVEYSFATVGVEGTGTMEPIGTPLVYDATASAFVPYLAQDISAVTASSLPDGVSPVAVSMGEATGLGVNTADISLSSTPVDVKVMWRAGAVKDGGIEWGSVTAPNQALFRQALEAQGIAVVESAADANPEFYTA